MTVCQGQGVKEIKETPISQQQNAGLMLSRPVLWEGSLTGRMICRSRKGMSKYLQPP